MLEFHSSTKYRHNIALKTCAIFTKNNIKLNTRNTENYQLKLDAIDNSTAFNSKLFCSTNFK